MRINEGFQDDSGSQVTLKSVTSVIVDELNPDAKDKKWRSRIFNSSSDSGIDSGGGGGVGGVAAGGKSEIGGGARGSRSLNGGGTEASSSSSSSSEAGGSTGEVDSVTEVEPAVESKERAPQAVVDKDGEEEKEREVVAILGSGDFGRALAGRLVQAGYVVNIGSRDPQRNA